MPKLLQLCQQCGSHVQRHCKYQCEATTLLLLLRRQLLTASVNQVGQVCIACHDSSRDFLWLLRSISLSTITSMNPGALPACQRCGSKHRLGRPELEGCWLLDRQGIPTSGEYSGGYCLQQLQEIRLSFSWLLYGLRRACRCCYNLPFRLMPANKRLLVMYTPALDYAPTKLAFGCAENTVNPKPLTVCHPSRLVHKLKLCVGTAVAC